MADLLLPTKLSLTKSPENVKVSGKYERERERELLIETL